jgi:hypothetical protein
MSLFDPFDMPLVMSDMSIRRSFLSPAVSGDEGLGDISGGVVSGEFWGATDVPSGENPLCVSSGGDFSDCLLPFSPSSFLFPSSSPQLPAISPLVSSNISPLKMDKSDKFGADRCARCITDDVEVCGITRPRQAKCDHCAGHSSKPNCSRLGSCFGFVDIWVVG